MINIHNGVFIVSAVADVGQPYSDFYEPTAFGSAGGGVGGGAGGGRLWLNVSDTLHLDGVLSVDGAPGRVGGGGGGSGGSLWVYCDTLRGYGRLHALGGRAGARSGGGAGGRVAMYFWNNRTFTEFRYLANGGRGVSGGEAGGAGTVFVYHRRYSHRTLIVDNAGSPPPRHPYVAWTGRTAGGRAWIMAAASGEHAFAGADHSFHFEEIRVLGGAHFAVLLPPQTLEGDTYVVRPRYSTDVFQSALPYTVSVFFRYMLGDRTGTVHVGAGQTLDLLRAEIDLPFSAYVYHGGHLGLAVVTVLHGVRLHLAGSVAHVRSLTLRQGGYLWLQHGGGTRGEPSGSYRFDALSVQSGGVVNATTDPVTEPGITLHVGALTVEGGGYVHGTRLTMVCVNVTVDAGGVLAADGQGYRPRLTQGRLSLYGPVNSGAAAAGGGGGGGHGGSGGRGKDIPGGGAVYGDLYQPYVLGSSGGSGARGLGGGSGGGALWLNVTGVILIDGVVSANGGDADDAKGGGGGSGGSVWMYCNVIRGYGRISANGGAGSGRGVAAPGGGGGGGRIAIYFSHNDTMSGFAYICHGGRAGRAGESEPGGGGTTFLYHILQQHRTLIIHNAGRRPLNPLHPLPPAGQPDSCRTWLLHETGSAARDALRIYDYRFEELQIGGAANVAVRDSPMSVHFRDMIGDRTATVHLSAGQRLDLNRPEIDLPFNVHAYPGSYLGLAPRTVLHGVAVWMQGELGHVTDLTVHHGGLLAMQAGGYTTGQSASHFRFERGRVQDMGALEARSDPLTPHGTHLTVGVLVVEGGGEVMGTNLTLRAVNVTVDDGGRLHANGLGYAPHHGVTGVVNRGRGVDSGTGSSGGGHGGTSGRGAGELRTGQAYDSVYEPVEYGSAGGGAGGGLGGGVIHVFVSDTLQLDGEIRAEGGAATTPAGGGGSGGSVWVECTVLKGLGNMTANGGAHHPGGLGGGGAGGRIALYLYRNATYWGSYQSHGGAVTDPLRAEPGGPGTVFIYHLDKQHTTLYVNNGRLVSRHVTKPTDYADLSRDSFKAWFTPQTGAHWLAEKHATFRFDELQIYGNAHLALRPHPLTEGATLHFRHMIGDRSGVIYIGKQQEMELRRDEIDLPFSCYVYDGGFLGLASITWVQQVTSVGWISSFFGYLTIPELFSIINT